MSAILKLPEMPDNCRECILEHYISGQGNFCSAITGLCRTDATMEEDRLLACPLQDDSHDALVARNAELGKALQTCLTAIKQEFPLVYKAEFMQMEQLLKKEDNLNEIL
jgi:hypothetical protein